MTSEPSGPPRAPHRQRWMVRAFSPPSVRGQARTAATRVAPSRNLTTAFMPDIRKPSSAASPEGDRILRNS